MLDSGTPGWLKLHLLHSKEGRLQYKLKLNDLSPKAGLLMDAEEGHVHNYQHLNHLFRGRGDE